MLTTIRYGLSLPGAILIRNDPNGFRDPSSVAYEMGIQQERKHQRFGNVFVHMDEIWLYVKRDPDFDGYSESPVPILASEISPQHWLKMKLGGNEAWCQRMLDLSYAVVRKGLTKRGQQSISDIENTPNNFLVFHKKALELCKADQSNYIRYSDDPLTPELSCNGRVVARFLFGKIELRNNTVIGPEKVDSWSQALDVATSQTSQDI